MLYKIYRIDIYKIDIYRLDMKKDYIILNMEFF